jgi:hypothetical protein
MRDIVFPVVVVAFFALATVLVSACDRLLEPTGRARDTEPDRP